MTAVTSTKPLTQWLDELITAEPVGRRGLSIAGLDDGIALRRVYCDRHKQPLNWLSAFAHLDRTEASHRLQHGPDARLHLPGDLRPAVFADTVTRPTGPWRVDQCSRCDSWIVWSTTAAGRSMPVDADPDHTGSVVLTTDPGGGERPLAVVLHSDGQRAQVNRGSVYIRHAQTCTPPRKRAARTSPSRSTR